MYSRTSTLAHATLAGVAEDVYCVHRAAILLPGCTEMTTCCHAVWQHAFASPPGVQGFERIAASGACCHWSDGPEAKAFWRSNAPGTQTLSSCADLCWADDGCQHFSHSHGFGMCVLCSGCALSVNGRNSHKYISWRREDNHTRIGRSDTNNHYATLMTLAPPPEATLAR